MLLEISYETTYAFTPPVVGGLTALRLRPSAGAGLVVHSSRLTAHPGALSLSYQDGWGTQVDIVESTIIHETSRFSMDCLVETHLMEHDQPPSNDDAWLYRADSPRVRKDASGALGWSLGGDQFSWAAVESVLRWFPQRFVYRIGVTDAQTPVEAFIEQGSGVCQDFTHAFLTILRSWGWCARYVSGYMFTGEPGTQRIESEAMHAWAEVYRPGFGWCGLDATSGTFADERYVPVARGRDYDDVRPIRGVVTGRTAQVQRARLAVQAMVPQQ